VSDIPVLKPREIAGRDISPALLRVIARDIAMDVRGFIGRR
jgi:hypothetical protein